MACHSLLINVVSIATSNCVISKNFSCHSMAADVNSPGFAFRIVRQAEKQAELGSRNYPTGKINSINSI